MYVCVCALSVRRVHLSVAPWTAAGQAPLSVGCPGRLAGVGCPALLQGVFLIQGPSPGLPHCRWVLYLPSHPGNPEHVTALFWFFGGASI